MSRRTRLFISPGPSGAGSHARGRCVENEIAAAITAGNVRFQGGVAHAEDHGRPWDPHRGPVATPTLERPGRCCSRMAHVRARDA